MNEVTRRNFYSWFISGAGLVIGAALSIPAALYLLFPNKPRKASSWIEAGDISQLAPNIPVELSFQQTISDGWNTTSQRKTAWVVDLPGQGVVAFGPQCTHLGCAYHFQEDQKQFLCPCHASVFALDGKVISGPAPRPLDRYSSKIENKKLFLGQIQETA
jgi:menaquinol-cytochrome c reductase iron-sulfur subunit